MTSRRSLRTQLTAAFVGLTTVVVLISAVGFGTLVKRSIWERIDAGLAEEADDLSMVTETGGPEALIAAVDHVAMERDIGDRRKFVRVTAPDGRVVAQSATLSGGTAAIPALGATQPRAILLGEGDSIYRIVSRAYDHALRIDVGVKAVHEARMLRRIYATIALAGSAIVLVLSALAWIITTRATADLQWLAKELETLEARTLDRRLTRRGSAEVDGLVTVLNRMLERLDRAVTHLRRFTADAAHELRTPIAGLRARLEVAVAHAQSAEARRDGLLDALEQTERLGCLAEDLLSLSVVEGGVAEHTAVHLGAVAREVAEFLEPVAEEHGRVFQCRAETGIVVHGSPSLLRRLLLNLVDNAMRHTPSAAGVALAVQVADGRATVQVHDGGPGIPAGALPLVFERFHRGHSATRGSGLGLALCQEIVRQHGGTIAIQSEIGWGTTVTVTLPLAVADARPYVES